ncbi:MAG: amidophosphoribosyltransferase [Candidatus Aureabacteria bacterium]|nr:amidophosphoribosyltransferase [Candidatus Auribacterota bacterium]
MKNYTDRPKDECGIFGIYGKEDASELTYLGLFALQHRGQESAGIISGSKDELKIYKNMGLVGKIFKKRFLDSLTGNYALGHVRYSTTGSSMQKNAQPLLISYAGGELGISHNGNLVNAGKLRNELEAEGSIFQTTVDSEIILHLIARDKAKDFKDKLKNALSQIQGAYSLGLIRKGLLIGVRDPNGFRPLCIGKLGYSHILSSETCALDLIGAEFIRDVEPGEIVYISDNGIISDRIPGEKQKKSFCIFEHIYFARPDSIIDGKSVHVMRKNMGRQLAKEHPVEADMVIPVPDSGNSAALGYAEESGIPFEMGIIRNHYIGRTFIQPSQNVRDFAVKIKLNPVKNIIKGKRIVVIDDSIVRGTTSRSRVRSLREAGAKEIHMRISCPPHRHRCVYGIDFPSESELLAANNDMQAIKGFLNVDSIDYLSQPGLLKALEGDQDEFCCACFDGNYPVKFDKSTTKFIHEKGTLITEIQ